MKDLSPLLPQMRLFLTFLDSLLEGESNFKMVLLVLETYGVLIDRMRHKIKPHLRSICSALLRHASNTKIVVRIENYRVIKKLMLCAKPNIVLNHMFDHLGDKRSVVREDVLNIVMYALLTFPSNEFDLKVRLLVFGYFWQIGPFWHSLQFRGGNTGNLLPLVINMYVL